LKDCNKLSSIIVSIEPEVAAVWTSASPSDVLELDGEAYRLAGPPADKLIFYDWLRDSIGRVVGVELHASDDDLLWLPVRSSKLVTTKTDFPRLLFRHSDTAVGRGDESFGDLSFYCSNAGRLVMQIGLEQWLNADEILELRSNIASKN
jgi:hypothetical protein